jgi:hypothetical protein
MKKTNLQILKDTHKWLSSLIAKEKKCSTTTVDNMIKRDPKKVSINSKADIYDILVDRKIIWQFEYTPITLFDYEHTWKS